MQHKDILQHTINVDGSDITVGRWLDLLAAGQYSEEVKKSWHLGIRTGNPPGTSPSKPSTKSPPCGAERCHRSTRVARRARENPASWVVLRGYRTSAIATQMRQSKYPAIDPRDYEIECRRNADGVRYDLYLKYVGKIVDEKAR